MPEFDHVNPILARLRRENPPEAHSAPAWLRHEPARNDADQHFDLHDVGISLSDLETLIRGKGFPEDRLDADEDFGPRHPLHDNGEHDYPYFDDGRRWYQRPVVLSSMVAALAVAGVVAAFLYPKDGDEVASPRTDRMELSEAAQQARKMAQEKMFADSIAEAFIANPAIPIGDYFKVIATDATGNEKSYMLRVQNRLELIDKGTSAVVAACLKLDLSTLRKDYDIADQIGRPLYTRDNPAKVDLAPGCP